jgi:HSP20 family protein
MLALRQREYPLAQLRDEMDRLFGEFFEGYPALTPWEPFARRTYPLLNTWEDAETLFVEAELPGVKSSEIEISLAGNELTVRVERLAPSESEETVYHRHERPTGPMCRTIRLPVDVQEDRVECVLRNGILTIKLPKSPTSRTRTIKVEAVR